jgi:predicted N-formylglutamate amidohydrolase
MSAQLSEAFELVAGAAGAGVVLTCEHASQHMPATHALAGEDARLVGTHWAYDLGARELTLACAEALGAPAVLSSFSRLLVDPNREEDHPDLFRKTAEGHPVRLNAALTPADRTLRLAQYYRPFHAAVRQCTAAARPVLLFSIHSFTPLYEGVPRSVQLGVLFNREEALAQAFSAQLARLGFPSNANEPWSGKAGLIFSAESHAYGAGARPLELEVRQDLACDPAYRARLVPALANALRTCIADLRSGAY